MSIDATEAGILNRTSPDAQKVGLGDEMKYESDYGIYTIPVTIAADATSGQSFTVPFACTLIDVVVQAKATSGSGTAKIRRSTTDITNAIVMATDTAITRCGNIIAAEQTLAAGTTYNVITAGSTDRGVVRLIVARAGA